MMNQSQLMLEKQSGKLGMVLNLVQEEDWMMQQVVMAGHFCIIVAL